MNKKTLWISMFLSLSLLTPSLRAQLANTIWTGKAKITVPALTQFENGRPKAYPRTLSGLSFVLPVEVWFWDSNKFLAVFRQGEFGADPSRAPLQPAFGEWTIPAAARVGGLAGIARVPYGSDLFEIQTGKYSRKNGLFQFTAETRNTADLSGYDSDWIYRTYRNLVTGTARLVNARTLSVTGTSITTPNPGGPNSLKASGGTSAIVTLTKTSRRPSTEGVGVFDDANY